jgi:RNA polymerase sigma-70 factor (ECF subfamily)
MSFPSSIWTTLRAVKQEPERVKDSLVRRYRQPVHEFLKRQGISHEDAEDLTQEIFVRICKDSFLERIDPEKGRFRSLLLAVSRHVLTSFRRHQLAQGRDRRREVALDDCEIPAEIPPDREFDRLWVQNLVREALDRLPPEPMILALRLQMEGKSYQEIGEKLGRPVTDVTNYVHRAKKRLREEIERLIEEYSGPTSRDEIAALLADLQC